MRRWSPIRRRLIAACGVEWSEACLAPHRNPRKIHHGEHLAGAPADLPHLGRAVAAVRALARRGQGVDAGSLTRRGVVVAKSPARQEEEEGDGEATDGARRSDPRSR
jgi:hypothetical protein